MGCKRVRIRTRAAIGLIAVWVVVMTAGLVIPTRVAAQTAGDARTALLIANGTYRHFGNLSTPVSEARDLAGALRSLGFTVTVVGTNHLIPVDAAEIMAALDESGSHTNIVVLDSCRNNPLPAVSGRSATRGLSRVDPPRNSIVVYSAESDSVAQDGVFTPALTRAITRRGASLNDVLIAVRNEVYEQTGGTQRPGEYTQLMEQVYLAGPPAGGSTAAVPAAPASSTGPSFGPVTVPTGSLQVSVATAATVTLLGQSAQIPAGRHASGTERYGGYGDGAGALRRPPRGNAECDGGRRADDPSSVCLPAGAREHPHRPGAGRHASDGHLQRR